jgi:glycosyltransferase involved in cell wall biosynthesis
MTTTVYSIIIPTKDRELQLKNLLYSICKQTLQPTEVIICSSGKDISNVVNLFKEDLRIIHIKSDIASQVFQKKLAIDRVSRQSTWVAFFDDDFLLEQTTMEEAFHCINNDKYSDRLGGLGFAVTNHSGKKNKVLSYYLRNKRGKVFKSGYNANYSDENSPTYTEWLNGASLWRSSVLFKYDNHLDNLRRSLGEDLIFSYEVSKTHLLIYCPSSKLSYQQVELDGEQISNNELKLYFYVYLYFVIRNSRLSLTQFYVFQLFKFFVALILKRRTIFRFSREFLSVYVTSIRVVFKKDKVLFIKNQLDSNR